MKELLFRITKKDFDVHWFSGTGAGGQHRNKHQNCCRLYHHDSGVRVTGQSHKSREANLKEAFRNMTNHPDFKSWMNSKIWECVEQKTIEEKVKESMIPENLKIEGRNDQGNWELYEE